MLPMASTVALLHSLGQDDQNVVKHDCFGHVTLLVQALASHDTNGEINGTTLSLRS